METAGPRVLLRLKSPTPKWCHHENCLQSGTRQTEGGIHDQSVPCKKNYKEERKKEK